MDRIPASRSLALTSCSSIRISGDSEFGLQAGDTFAWSPSTPREMEGDVPWEEFHQAITSSLNERGLKLAEIEEADVVVSADLDIKVITVNNDPDYDVYAAERYEQGILTVELSAGVGSESGSVWRGQCRHRLRYVARAEGIGGDWYAVEGERRWRVQKVVEKVLERLPQWPPGSNEELETASG